MRRPGSCEPGQLKELVSKTLQSLKFLPLLIASLESILTKFVLAVLELVPETEW